MHAGAGAEVVGGDELVASIQEAGGGGLPFDKCLATADMMPRLAKIARILGPRGMMPNPKLGTIVAPGGLPAAIAATKAGRVEYRCARADPTLALTLIPSGSHVTGLHASTCQALCSGRRAWCPTLHAVAAAELPNRPPVEHWCALGSARCTAGEPCRDCCRHPHGSVGHSQCSARTRRADKGGVLHAGFGRVSFADAALRENFAALVTAVVAARPKKAKGANFGGYVTKARDGSPPSLACARATSLSRRERKPLNRRERNPFSGCSAKIAKMRCRISCWSGDATSCDICQGAAQRCSDAGHSAKDRHSTPCKCARRLACRHLRSPAR